MALGTHQIKESTLDSRLQDGRTNRGLVKARTWYQTVDHVEPGDSTLNGRIFTRLMLNR